ncbi:MULTISPECIES: SDR family NAD(P)-dependent oxidoreductase [Acinetobacter]|uniref:SDR family NAD(P)-dependent oxidoreductase n=1 Tax=Acinetobacter TaxID=469 RepID=UPI000CECAAFF|nr:MULTISPECIES: SDR family NAD(P)-dependent oxidoreductase [Acinetobacter]MDM1275543.1 SDR family NAD(P)-dependent oxidoreductase [Acinetobacter indicus]MDM1301646.1 SDR family NAD(P)-dependent oxidoreductase [Acinetobacter indicus]MDM1330503.1 SDR family NAD(P)-dependent oxidoreductase [Acinetobacter indicus]MDM1338827.1 SDR family NAD(P)-dependent oxidoreductase [Acinetobacter indicus]MDM1771014.1 SDR family NAD(P)-dependent oxidoreductase [Acinetobacter indicus]
MILVTGGLGFIGSHIALSLMAQGQEVIIVDNLSNANLQTLERLEYISGMYVPFAKIDIRNTPALNKVFEQYSVDAVVHTASFKSLEESVLKPLEYYNDNVSCIMSLLRAMQRTGVRVLVHLSSLTVYGQSSLQLKEDLPFQYAYPNPYIKSQQMAEEIIQDTFKTDNEWKIALLRLGNIAGAFEHGVLGEMVPPLPKNIVPLAMQVGARQREFIELRKQAQTEDKTVERSFLHVLDCCEAVSLTLQWLFQQQHVCEAFNIAGEAISIQQLLNEISSVTGTEIKTVDADVYPYAELDQVAADISKAKEVLGWQPKRSIQQMLEDEWRFYQHTLRGQ